MTGAPDMTMHMDEKVQKALSLKKRNSFINTNMQSFLPEEWQTETRTVQKFCEKYEKSINGDHSQDYYPWIKDFGKEALVSRSHKFPMLDLPWDRSNWGLRMEFCRAMAVDFFDPQFNMSMGATVLAINPLRDHHDNDPERLQALKELVTGEEVGCILITEPDRGSDAVHMLSTCDRNEDGSYTLNAEKIYNTNAPKSKWAVVYATTEKNNDAGMAQFLVNTSQEGWSCPRMMIPWVPRIHLGKPSLKDVKVPANRVLGEPGKGKTHLFEGLVPERIGIAVVSAAQAWGAFTHAAIYANLREQFNKPIIKWQGVGFLLADIWARLSNYTTGLWGFCEKFDGYMEKYDGHIPEGLARALVPAASMFKYQGAILSERICYEAANAMGGMGVNDNTLVADLLGISRIQEVIGGTRQIQQYILSGALRQLWKMSA